MGVVGVRVVAHATSTDSFNNNSQYLVQNIVTERKQLSYAPPGGGAW